MQAAARGPQPIGVIFNTSMSRPDSALALAALYGFEGKREARIGAVCVVGAGLDTAIFCDIVGRFYSSGPQSDSNKSLPVGLADASPLPPDSPMVKAAVERRNEKGDLLYPRNVRRLSDTSVAEAVLRNGVTPNAESAMVLSAPATYLAKSLDLLGVKELYKERVKRLVIVDSGESVQDVAALRKVLAEFPSPIIFCGKEVGESLVFPGASIETEFSWAPAHPVADAYRAYNKMPYDAQSYDLAAIHYAIHPDSGFFQLSAPGAVSIAGDGRLKLTPGAGNVRSLVVDSSKKELITQAMVEVAGARPVKPPQRGRPPAQ
jgi:hypothetical protein